MNTDFSIGRAVLRLTNHPEQVPQDWRDALLRPLDSQSRAALSQMCTTSHAWMLQHWPDAATLSVAARSASDEAPAQHLRRLRAASDQLRQRGGKPTTLVLVQRGRPIARDDPWWRSTLTGLSTGAPNFTLALQLQHIPAALVAHAGAVFSGLTSLTIGAVRGVGCVVVLPPAEALPALRHLTVNRVARSAQAALWSSAGPYIAQL